MSGPTGSESGGCSPAAGGVGRHLVRQARDPDSYLYLQGPYIPGLRRPPGLAMNLSTRGEPWQGIATGTRTIETGGQD